MVPVEAANIAKGDAIWTQEFVIRDLRLPINKLFRHYLAKRSLSQSQRFELCLALVLLWCKIL